MGWLRLRSASSGFAGEWFAGFGSAQPAAAPLSQPRLRGRNGWAGFGSAQPAASSRENGSLASAGFGWLRLRSASSGFAGETVGLASASLSQPRLRSASSGFAGERVSGFGFAQPAVSPRENGSLASAGFGFAQPAATSILLQLFPPSREAVHMFLRSYFSVPTKHRVPERSRRHPSEAVFLPLRSTGCLSEAEGTLIF